MRNDIEKKIKEINWQLLASRREALLFRSITNSSCRYFRGLTNIAWQQRHRICFSNGPFFVNKKEADKLDLIFLKGGVRLFSNLAHPLVFNVKSFDKIAHQIEKINCSKLSKNQLVSLLTDYFNAALHSHCFLEPMPIADRSLSRMILDLLPPGSDQEKQKWLGTLIFPARENEYIKEEKSFFNLARVYKKDKKFNYLLNRHLKNFAWIGGRWYWWENTWKKEDVLERLNNFFLQKKNPVQELKNLENIKKQRNEASKKLLKELKIKPSSPIYKLIKLARSYAYLRTWRTDTVYGAGCRAKNLFYEVARRAGLKENDIVYLTFEEVLQMAKTEKIPLSLRELNERKEFSAGVLMDNKCFVLSGKKWQERLETILNLKQEESKEIKGNIAFSGQLKGMVKIVQNVADIKKVERGDILVAVMTFPHFLPAMEKAVAFVTDEGGILCHAAIISREMKKPCIIGTKNATKVLKDGDLVEVDANKGIVRLVKK